MHANLKVQFEGKRTVPSGLILWSIVLCSLLWQGIAVSILKLINHVVKIKVVFEKLDVILLTDVQGCAVVIVAQR